MWSQILIIFLLILLVYPENAIFVFHRKIGFWYEKWDFTDSFFASSSLILAENPFLVWKISGHSFHFFVSRSLRLAKKCNISFLIFGMNNFHSFASNSFSLDRNNNYLVVHLIHSINFQYFIYVYFFTLNWSIYQLTENH